MVDPAVVSTMDTVCAVEYVPDATENVGVATVVAGVAVFAAVVITVIENGGSETTVAGLKPLRVFVVVWTVSEVSLLSVILAEVTWFTCTVPVGALGPEKVTGSAVV